MLGEKPSVQIESGLKDWLEDIGLGHYGELFAQHRIDLDVVSDLTESDLAELGVPLGDRRRLQRAMMSLVPARLANSSVNNGLRAPSATVGADMGQSSPRVSGAGGQRPGGDRTSRRRVAVDAPG